MHLLQGKNALKQKPRTGRENITVLGVCSAAGIALDPPAIFQGKNMLSTWFRDEALLKAFYGNSENSKNITINEINTLILSLSFLKKKDNFGVLILKGFFSNYMIADLTNR